MATDNNDLAAQVVALQSTVTDLKAQCDMLYRKLGYPTWENHKKQAMDNAKAQGTKLPTHPTQAFGEIYRRKPYEV